MQTQPILSPEDLLHFEKWGWVRVQDAIPRDVAQGVSDFCWKRAEENGVSRDDRSTWPQQWFGINKKEIDRAVPSHIGPRLEGAVNDLLGENGWNPLSKLGGLLWSFPQKAPDEWGVTPHQWHTDHDASVHLGVLNGLMLFTFFSSVRPRGGGTLALAGSPRLFERFFADTNYIHRPEKGIRSLPDALAEWHPTLAELWGRALVVTARPINGCAPSRYTAWKCKSPN